MTDPQPTPDAHGRAARAYAQTLLDPDAAAAAALDALAAFRRTLESRPDLAGSPEETLLALTRLMTAVSLPDRSTPEDRRQAVWASIGATSHCTCREAGPLLATRANATIQPRESAALDEHLADCAACRELAARAEAAEAAFRRELVPPHRPGIDLGAVPRSPLLALVVLLVAGLGSLLLFTGGGHHATPAAAATVLTQAPSRFATASTPATVPVHPARRSTTRPPTIRHHTTRHRTPRHVTPSSARRRATTPVTAAAPTPTVAPAVTSSPAPVQTTPAPTEPVATEPATSAPAASAPATAASSGGSLPAESAPQQGIGTLTTSGQ